MAFATSNVKPCSFGPLKVTFGDWTGAVGDAPGTIDVSGGRVYLAVIMGQDPTGPYVASVNTPISVSTSGSVTTVTVYNNDTVTTGRFLIISA